MYQRYFYKKILQNFVSFLSFEVQAKTLIVLYLIAIFIFTFYCLAETNFVLHSIKQPFSLNNILILDYGVISLFIIVYIRNIPIKSRWGRVVLTFFSLIFLLTNIPTL